MATTTRTGRPRVNRPGRSNERVGGGRPGRRAVSRAPHAAGRHPPAPRQIFWPVTRFVTAREAVRHAVFVRADTTTIRRMNVTNLLTVSEAARRLGVRPRDLSDLFYQRRLPDDLCPLVGGRRL